jgi:hypothetical protein
MSALEITPTQTEAWEAGGVHAPALRWRWFAPALVVMWIVGMIDKVGVGVIAANNGFLSSMHLAGKPTQIGLLTTVMLIFYGLFMPVWGALVDRFGPRRCSIAGLTLWGLSTARRLGPRPRSGSAAGAGRSTHPARLDMTALRPWSTLSAIEQSLVRGGLRTRRTAGTIQAHGMALRWSHAPHAPLTRGYTYADQHELVPEFANAASNLIAQSVLNVRYTTEAFPQDSDPTVAPGELERVLHDPATWIWNEQEPHHYWLDVPRSAHEHWYHPAYVAMARSDYPAWRELGEPEQAILVSAMEASGMLTGPFGIWSQPQPALTPPQRLDAVDELLAPLLPFVRDGLLEVQFRADARSTEYTVIPLSELRSAFNGTEIWRDHDEADFFENAHAVFTFVGYATWHRPQAAAATPPDE